MPAPQELITRLNQVGITEAAVVDETFDPPTQADIEDELDEFFEELKADPDSRQSLLDEEVPCAQREEFLRVGLGRLWAQRKNYLGKVATIVQKLLAPFIARQRDPERVAEHLEALK